MLIIKIDPKNPAKAVIQKVANVILKGGSVAIPTDTAYGLAVNACDSQALAKLDLIKGRLENKPYPIAVLDLNEARKYAVFNLQAIKLARKFWPGALTLVLKRKKSAKTLSGGAETVGLRVPASSFCHSLSKILGLPYTITSANLSGAETPYSAAAVLAQFRGARFQPDLIIDNGALPIIKTSTVVDLSGKKLKILREGAIAKERILHFLKRSKFTQNLKC